MGASNARETGLSSTFRSISTRKVIKVSAITHIKFNDLRDDNNAGKQCREGIPNHTLRVEKSPVKVFADSAAESAYALRK